MNFDLRVYRPISDAVLVAVSSKQVSLSLRMLNFSSIVCSKRQGYIKRSKNADIPVAVVRSSMSQEHSLYSNSLNMINLKPIKLKMIECRKTFGLKHVLFFFTSFNSQNRQYLTIKNRESHGGLAATQLVFLCNFIKLISFASSRIYSEQ